MSVSVYVVTNGTQVTAYESGGEIASGTNARRVVQAGIDALSPGERLVIGSGEYTLDGTLTVTGDSLTVEGEGWGRHVDSTGGTVLRAAEGFGGDVVRMGRESESVFGSALRNLAVVGNYENGNGVSLYGNQSEVTTLVVANNGRHGVANLGGNPYSENRMFNVVARDNGVDGISNQAPDARIAQVSSFRNDRGISLRYGGTYCLGFNVWDCRSTSLLVDSSVRQTVGYGYLDSPDGERNLRIVADGEPCLGVLVGNVQFVRGVPGIEASSSGADIHAMATNCYFEASEDAVTVGETEGRIHVSVADSVVTAQSEIPVDGVTFRGTQIQQFENGGEATVTNGGGVSHELAAEPTIYRVSSLEPGLLAYVTDVTSSELVVELFDVSAGTVVDEDCTVVWEARVR